MTDGSFPAGWALMKPQQTIDPANFARLWRAGKLIATKKWDGNRAHVITAGAATRVWSRNGTVELTAKLPRLVDHFAIAPTGILFDVELHTMEEGTESIQAAFNSGHDDDIYAAAFDMLKLDGSMTNSGYGYRLSLLQQQMDMLGRGPAFAVDHFPLGENADYEEALRRIAQKKIEGIVVADRNAPHVLNLNGNTKRGQSWKIKHRHTEDFVVVGRNACADPKLGVGSVKLARRLEDGTLQPVKGPVGSFGLSFNRLWALEQDGLYVVEVSHFGEDERGNLVFPKVERARPDLNADFGILAKAA